MLKKLRKKETAKKVWIFLAIIILPAFVLWGAGSMVRDKSQPSYAGKIFGKTVTYTEYKEALEATKNQAILQYGDKFVDMQKYLNLEAQAWERLILLTEAKKRRIRISDKEVVALIENYPFFQNNGRFSPQIYEQMLRYVFNTPARVFEEQTRENLMLVKIYDSVTKNIKLSDTETEEAYAKENESISINYIAALDSEFAKDINPTEEEVRKYFEANSFEFKQPLSFNLEYIVTDSEDKLKSVISRLNKKEDFHKVAKELNFLVKESGYFTQTDPIPGIGWSPQILSLLPKLKPGQLLPAIHMDKNYFIMRLKDKKEPHVPEFADIKTKAREVYIKKKGREIAKAKIEDCLKKLNAAPKTVDFSKYAKELGLKSGSTEMFKYNSYIEGIGASDKLWMAAYNLKDDSISNIIDMEGGFYIIKVKSLTPIDKNKFESEKKDFAQKLLQQKKQEYFIKYVEELKRKAQIS